MTSNEVVTVPSAAVATPDRVGQATAIEQSRAIAEVQAAILVAQQCPRNVPAALAEMREACAQPALAERAFFRFSRGGGQVSGPSVYLARELARCWGNMQHGVSELRRDDGHGQSEMQAYAWDLQKNTRVATVFVVPHMRDKKGGPQKLVDMRDIYENNANNGARRVRETIYSVLPVWFVDEAKQLCLKTLQDGGGKPMARRIADIIAAFEELGVTVAQLEQKTGRDTDQWTAHDLAQLTVIGKSLKLGEVQREDEFPPERVTADEIAGGAVPAQKPGKTPPPAVEDDDPTLDDDPDLFAHEEAAAR